MYRFAQLVKQNVPDAGVQAAAQAVIDAVGEPREKAVLAQRYGSGKYRGEHRDLEHSHGVSIYLLVGKSDWRLDLYNGEELSFTADTAWDEFVKDLVNAVGLPTHEPPRPIDPDNRPGPLQAESPVYLPLVTR